MIKIICVGKLKESYWKEAILEYEKRLSRYHGVQVIQVDDCNHLDGYSNLRQEADNILNHIMPKDFVVALSIEGKSYDSVGLAKQIDEWIQTGKNIIFIIGGSYGLSNQILNRAQIKLSFSKLTFPHQMFRVMLLEQVYRSFKIIKKETYHK